MLTTEHTAARPRILPILSLILRNLGSCLMPTLEKINKTILSLFWPFFPVFIVMFVLWLSGQLFEISSRSDVMLVSSVLFAESLSRCRSQTNSDKDATELFGIIGAMVAVILACLILLKETDVLQSFSSIFLGDRFAWAQFTVFICAVTYAFVVRWREIK